LDVEVVRIRGVDVAWAVGALAVVGDVDVQVPVAIEVRPGRADSAVVLPTRQAQRFGDVGEVPGAVVLKEAIEALVEQEDVHIAVPLDVDGADAVGEVRGTRQTTGGRVRRREAEVPVAQEQLRPLHSVREEQVQVAVSVQVDDREAAVRLDLRGRM
jgi:hypothetical protein